MEIMSTVQAIEKNVCKMAEILIEGKNHGGRGCVGYCDGQCFHWTIPPRYIHACTDRAAQRTRVSASL